MKLDIVIPTYNRAGLLQQTLASVARAVCPPEITLSLIVVDNNSRDDTRSIVEAWSADSPCPVQYIFEKNQGRSHALNAGVAASNADLVGMIDDDEEIAEDWIAVVARCFADRPDLAFIGGPYRGNWSQEPPPWLPWEFPAVVGVLDGGPEVRTYSKEFGSILPGGNAVVRRDWLIKAGPYNTAVGRTGTNLLGAEDVDMYHRLLALGAVGEYRPDLIIYHHIPPERLTRRYFRSWAHAHGRSLGTLDRGRPQQVAYFMGVPRYQIRRALAAASRLALKPGRRRTAPDKAFADELRLREFLSFLGSRWFSRH